jgi:uncharacterized protein (DUF983 family)
MQCPFCASEISSNAVVCASCGATRLTQRSTAGIITGWLGVVGVTLVGLLWVGLLFLPFTTHGLTGFPWVTFAVGSIIVAGLLWYSQSTKKPHWIRKQD